MVVKKSEVKLRDEDRPYVEKAEKLIDQRLRETFHDESTDDSCIVAYETIKAVTNHPGSSTYQIIEMIKTLYRETGWEVSYELPLEDAEGGYFKFK